MTSAGVEEKHWWTGGTDLYSEGDWLWSDSLDMVGGFIWAPGQPDGADQQNCLYLNPHYDYSGRDDDCHIRKQPLYQLYLPTTSTSTAHSSTTSSSTPSSTTTPITTTTTQSTTSDPFTLQKCCSTVRLESSGLVSSLKPDYVGTYRKIVMEITNRSVYHHEDKFLFYLSDRAVLGTEAWVISTSMDVFPEETMFNPDDDLCADNTAPTWQLLVDGEWKEDRTAVLRCERTGECEADSECNEGLSGVCGTDQEGLTVDCEYCGKEGECLPGCSHDWGSPEVPRCPPGLPVCNTETHQCQAESGSTLLDKIVVTSHSCEGCITEGLNMTLAGNEVVVPQPRCKTVDLDHPNQVDFQSKSIFIASPEEQDMGWGNCWKVQLNLYH